MLCRVGFNYSHNGTGRSWEHTYTVFIIVDVLYVGSWPLRNSHFRMRVLFPVEKVFARARPRVRAWWLVERGFHECVINVLTDIHRIVPAAILVIRTRTRVPLRLDGDRVLGVLLGIVNDERRSLDTHPFRQRLPRPFVHLRLRQRSRSQGLSRRHHCQC